jgi:RNA polymerase sigma-70 factor (ECF subfamily)
VDDRELAGLVVAAQRGDGLAMAELLDALAPAVGQWCGPIALQDAPDAAQEALIAVFRGLKGLRDPAALFGWARAITVREAVRVARRAARERPAELADLPAPDDPMLAVDVRDVLERLTPEHRAILMLRDLEGFDERSVADALGTPVGTVKSRLSRARDNFRKGWGR